VVIVHNEDGGFLVERVIGMTLSIPKDFIRFSCSIYYVGKMAMEGIDLTSVNLEPCSYQILMSMGESKKAWGLIKHEVVI
jgi:hypothetical protein